MNRFDATSRAMLLAAAMTAAGAIAVARAPSGVGTALLAAGFGIFTWSIHKFGRETAT